jgi:hypothetical protein
LQFVGIKRWWVLLVSLGWLLVAGATASGAQERFPVAGEMVLAVNKYQEINVGDTKDHSVFLLEYEGNNVSKDKQEFMHESQATMLLFGDLVKKSGPIQGYWEFRKGEDTVFFKWEGKLNTVYSSRGTPGMTFEGTFSYIKGTGRYAGIEGGGAFRGKMISWVFRVFEWKGEYSIKK